MQSQHLQAVSSSVWSLQYQVQRLNVYPHTACTVSIQLLSIGNLSSDHSDDKEKKQFIALHVCFNFWHISLLSSEKTKM